MDPLISICIPAFKNPAYLEALLQSIRVQSFRDFEVLVSDDSPGDEVENLCRQFETEFFIRYKKNTPAKGSPGNWNSAIAMAKGKWIKLMHDDDWFANEHSLASFANATEHCEGAGFIFSGYTTYENGEPKKTSVPGSAAERKLKRSPLSLISNNFIGHPSNTMIINNGQEWYDENTKWVVDFEFYIRCLQQTAFYAIKKPLINIGVNDQQITKASFRNASIEIPENLYLLQKMGVGILKQLTVYDYYWRLFRNLETRSLEDILRYRGGQVIPFEIKQMLKRQFKIPLSILKFGPASKLFMAMSFAAG